MLRLRSFLIIHRHAWGGDKSPFCPLSHNKSCCCSGGDPAVQWLELRFDPTRRGSCGVRGIRCSLCFHELYHTRRLPRYLAVNPNVGALGHEGNALAALLTSHYHLCSVASAVCVYMADHKLLPSRFNRCPRLKVRLHEACTVVRNVILRFQSPRARLLAPARCLRAGIASLGFELKAFRSVHAVVAYLHITMQHVAAPHYGLFPGHPPDRFRWCCACYLNI